MGQPLFLLVLQFIAFILIICILYGILYNVVLNLNMPKWTAHMVATLFSLGSAYQAFVIFLYNTQQKGRHLRRPFYYFTSTV
ncbi:hypothetical protein BACERE00193_02810 [Bacillus paranthracis]|nr:hypothetical protein BACERE00193_02810 [Bacillus paranthracis]